MEKKLTKEQVLEALGLHSFRELTPEKMPDFLDKEKEMSKGELKDSLSEIPDFAELIKETFSFFKVIGEKTLAGNEESMKRFHNLCDTQQKALEELLKRTDDFDKQMKIIDKMTEIRNDMFQKDTENKGSVEKRNREALGMGLVVGMVICAGIYATARVVLGGGRA